MKTMKTPSHLEGDVDGVELDLLVEDLDLQVQLEERVRHGPQLADGVVDEAAPLAAVVQLEAGVGLVVAEVGGGADPAEKKEHYKISLN